jgi:nucleoprotein TPR
MRLIEVQLETSVASEKRIESEAGALRVEIARQETLLSSVQRIEASLMAKAESEREHLRDELRRIQESKLDDDTKHDAAVQKLEGKIADMETTVKDLTVQKDTATVSATKASLDCSNLNLKVQELTLELKSAEKELKAAKMKLGDVTIDTSAEEALEAKVVSLTAELESTKVELATAQTRIADYQAIAMSSEKQLANLTDASKKYKDETTATLKTLRQSEQAQCETVAELTKDLMSYRGEKEKAVNELKATIDSLTSQLSGSKEDAAKAIAMSDSLTADARRYQLDAKNANVNYERELALHAEARAALRDARSGMESEHRLRKTIESQLASAQAEIEAEKVAWASSKAKLEESLLEAKSRLDDMRTQNNMLHDQMASLSVTVDKIQSAKAAALMGNDTPADSAEKSPDAAGSVREKQLSDLRELLRFKQSECGMLEADLASAKRASERERIAAELTNRSLEEARSELKVLRELEKDNIGGASASEKAMCDLRVKLNSAEEQLVLLRESNTMLREESHKVTKKLSEVQSQLDSLKSSTAPQTKMINNMEVERASLEAEKESLSREVEAWKNRVHNLVSKFNQIDPEDYAQARASVDQLKCECETLKAQKELSDANTTKAEGLVARLNKEIESQKASIAAFKNALEKTKKEKEELSKTATSNKITNTKIAAAQVRKETTLFSVFHNIAYEPLIAVLY